MALQVVFHIVTNQGRFQGGYAAAAFLWKGE